MKQRDLDAATERLLRRAGPSAVLASLARSIRAHLRASAPSPRDVTRIAELRVWDEFCQEDLSRALEQCHIIEDEAGYPYDQRHAPAQQGRGGYLELLFPWTRR